MNELEDALAAAREAYDAASKALRLAEETAGISVTEARPVLEELTVKRINVVEDDGTLRLVIGNSTVSGLLPVRGRVLRHPGRFGVAGMLFINDEGTECGGLLFSGKRGESENEQGVYLAFDQYEQNDSLRIGLEQVGDSAGKVVEFVDQPAWSIADVIEEADGRDASAADSIFERYAATGQSHSRLRLAREDDGSARLVLRDGEGRDRIRLVVPMVGDPVVEVLDAEGNVRSLL